MYETSRQEPQGAFNTTVTAKLHDAKETMTVQKLKLEGVEKYLTREIVQKSSVAGIVKSVNL